MGYLVDQSKGMLGKPDSVELWEQIICTIPDSVLLEDDVQILCVAVGHGTEADVIAKRMIKLGRTVNEVKNAIVLLDKYSEFTNLAKQKGYTRVVLSDFLDWEPDMKFDVVVGNPPYQNPNNDKKMLWNEFMDKSLDVCNDNGYIAMVTPATWLTASTNIHNSYRAFEEYEVLKAVVYSKSDTPFDVGSTISYHITQKSEKKNKTELYFAEWSKHTETLVSNVNLKTDKIWPGEMSAINLGIHKKLQAFSPIVFTKSCEFHNQKLKTKQLVSDTKTTKFPYTHHVSAAITRYTSVKFSKHSDWKVMVPLTSTINKAVVDKDCGHGEDMLTLYVNNQQTALNIKALFQTKMYKFIGMMYKSGRNQVLQGIFPSVDFSKTWTDEKLYKLFKLTQQESDYIESYVK